MAQLRQGLNDEDKNQFLNAFATTNPPQPAEPPCLGRAWMARWGQSSVCMCLQMPTFLGLLRDVGRYEGLAPSMWAFPAWFWRMNRTCAIYVPLLSPWLKFKLCFSWVRAARANTGALFGFSFVRARGADPREKNIFSRRAPTEEAKGRQLDVEEENWVQTSLEGCKK